MRNPLSRRSVIRGTVAGAAGITATAALYACGETKIVTVEKVVEKEVPVEKIIEKEVPVDRIVEKIIEKEVPIERIVIKEVAPQKAPSPPIRFMNYWSSGQRWETMKVGLEIFDKKFPEIQYTLEPLPPRFYQEKSAIMFAAGTIGDLLIMNGGQMFQFEGNLLPVNDIAPKLGVDFDDYVILEHIHPDRPSVWTNEIAGQMYAFPFMIGSVGGWYYNVSMFEAEGVENPSESWTWDTQDDALKKLSDPEKPQYGTWNRNNTEVQLFERIAEAGGKHFKEVDRPYLTAGFDDTASVGAFERWMNMIHVDKVAPAPSEIASMGMEGVKSPWYSGQIGMMAGGIHTPGNHAHAINDRFAFDIMPNPKGPNGNHYINNQLGHFITRKAEDRGSSENTIIMAAWLAGDEFQELVANWRGAVPTTKEMINSDAWLKPGGALPTNMNIINNNLFADNVYGNHCFDGWSEWFWNIISGETELAWIGEKDPKATILDLAAATTKFANELQE